MTIATLDREAVAAELVVTTPVILPFDPPPRPAKPDFIFTGPLTPRRGRNHRPVGVLGIADRMRAGRDSF